MRISDWSSDVCSSDLLQAIGAAQIGRGHAKAAAEGAVEIGQVTETAGIGNRCDRPRCLPRMQQQAMSAVEPFAQNMIRKAASLILKQAADIARPDARAGGYATTVAARLATPRANTGFDRRPPPAPPTGPPEPPITRTP